MNNQKLHERIIAGIVLVTISLAAYAVEHGVTSGTAMGVDRASACSSAKYDADQRATTRGLAVGVTVTGHSSCDCSQSGSTWTCTVDAYWEKK